jgi:hypothetical protein
MDLRFDWCSELDTELFNSLIDTICSTIDENRNRRGQSPEQILETQSKERIFTKQIITALYSAYFTLPQATSRVSLPLTEGFYTDFPFGKRIVKKVFDLLIELNWIDHKIGIEGVGYTRIWAVGELALQFDALGFRWFPQALNPADSLVVLRDYESEGSKKKVVIPTPETAEVSLYRDSLCAFNQFLIEQCVALNLDDQQLVSLAQQMAEKANEEAKENPWLSEAEKQRVGYLDFSCVQLTRIFARGSMTEGGRFYRGWWQSLPSLYRPHITINGLKTCEVDYSGMAIGIMYAQIGVQFPLDRDPYDIGFIDWQGTTDPRRKLIKKFFNALINDERGNYRLKKKEQDTVGVSHEELLSNVLGVHASIADRLSTGAGLGTQFIDSEIASYVMHKMMAQGVLVLPIHDSFIVRDGYEAELNEAMLEAYKHYTGAIGKVSADYPRLPEHFGMNDEEFNNEQERLRGDPSHGVVGVEDTEERVLGQTYSIMDGYVASWEALAFVK